MNQKGSSEQIKKFTFLPFLEGKVVNESEADSDGKFFLAISAIPFLIGQEKVSEPKDVIKLPNGCYLRHKRCENLPLISRHL